jgi:hydroxymethylbilane synthase
LNKIRLGTRKSPLALAQANKIADILITEFNLNVVIVPIVTTGDKIQDKALYEIGGKSLFIKELEEALLRGEIDIAVHSLKDIPAHVANGLKIGAVMEREDPRDAIISLSGYDLQSLPYKAVVGTSSTRRKIQLLRIRPDLNIVPCRGNIDSRINKMYGGQFDAIILAKVGIDRLHLNVPAYTISTDIMPPAPGQGVLALQVNMSNNMAIELCDKLNHVLTWQVIQAERGFVEALNASCRTPIAAFAHLIIETNIISAQYMLASFDGNQYFTKSATCKLADAYQMAVDVAKDILIRI